MIKEIYEYLSEYGFDSIEIDKIIKSNQNIYFSNVEEIKKNIKFLEEKFLEYDDILELIINNPFMLTEKNNRLEALDNIYNNILSFDYETLKLLLKNNSETYTISPVELEKIIEYLKEKNISNEIIRNLIIKNSKIITLTLEEFKDLVKGEI